MYTIDRLCTYIYAVYIMIQCTEPAIPAVIACSELPVSLQEAVLGLKTPSPMTVLLEREEGFFRQEQIKRRKTSASNIQADADRCKQRQTVSLVDVTHSLDNNISPPKFNWSAQPKCWPRPIVHLSL